MKLPAIWPAVFLGGGILLSISAVGHLRFISDPRVALLGAAGALIFGGIALGRGWLRAGLIVAAAAWLLLGASAAEFERASAPSNLASTLIDSGKLDSSVALHWRGRLQADPLPLPWGTRYQIALADVESAAGALPVSGGLRLTLYRDDAKGVAPPAVRAGDSVEVLARALPVRDFADPGSFDYRGYLAGQGVDLDGTLRSPELLTVLGHPPLSLGDRLARVHGALLNAANGLFPARPDQAAILRAMLLGDRTFIDHDRSVEFQQTGVYHVLVLAGLHVGVLTAFFLWAGRRLGLRLLPRTLLTLAALAMYAAIVEDRPPILRAVLMATIYLTARLLYRRMDILNVAALAALFLLAARPSQIVDSSFLLSFAAMGVIGTLALPWLASSSEPYRHGLQALAEVHRDVSHPPRVIQFRLEVRTAAAWLRARLPKRAASIASGTAFLELLAAPLRGALWLWELLLLSVLLQIGMLPLMAYYFHRVALAGPLANIPALLLTGLIVPLGFVTLAASFFWRGLAQICARGLGFLIALLDSIVRWFAGWRGMSYRIPGPPLPLMLGFALTAIALAFAIAARHRLWQWSGALALLALAGLIASYPFAPSLSATNLEVTVLDVGQGDSLFVSFPGGHTMLVDSGGALGVIHSGGMRSGLDIGEDVVSPYLWSRGIKNLEVVALTHAHEDHLGGMASVLENFPVRELWVGRDIDIPAYRELLAIAARRGVRVMHLKQGDSFARGGVSGSVLWPDNLDEHKSAENDDSLVLRLTDGAQSMLLTGDIERPSERKILSDTLPPAASSDCHADGNSDENAGPALVPQPRSRKRRTRRKKSPPSTACLDEASEPETATGSAPSADPPSVLPSASSGTVSSTPPLAAGFLKVAHHGAKTSTTDPFLAAVHPAFAAISAGRDNPFGHPSVEVIERLEAAGVRVYRTDRDGAITASTDGHSLTVSSFLHPAH